jgi:GNAT superfamily N-acetyltransferase
MDQTVSQRCIALRNNGANAVCAAGTLFFIIWGAAKLASCQPGLAGACRKIHAVRDVISPGKVYKDQGVISLRKVGGQEEISSWCRAFKASFGYAIDESTLERTHPFIPYYSLLFNGHVGGTLMLYVTGDILGVHSLGVIPQLRGKGIARHAMHSTLNLAAELGAKAVTLQASEMALPLYEQLGFLKQFAMKNYILKK